MLMKIKTTKDGIIDIKVSTMLNGIFHRCQRCGKFVSDAKIRRLEYSFRYTFMAYVCFCDKCNEESTLHNIR